MNNSKKKSPGTYIIAEAGVNHNGCIETAHKLVDVAAASGADAVKFQTFQAHKLATIDAPKATYQGITTDRNESQWEMLHKLELNHSAHLILRDYCDEQGIEFLSTPFDLESAHFLVEGVKVSRLKIPSGELTNGPFLLGVARLGVPVILSTGMSTLGEIGEALAVLAHGFIGSDEIPSREAFIQALCSIEGQSKLRELVTLLHCTSEYPAPLSSVNLRAMSTVETAFGLPVGYSDHTNGITVPIAAVARGATIIEKHFTLDRLAPGPDHVASLEPDELTSMVKSIREVEEVLGGGRKLVSFSEWGNRTIARKSLVARKPVNRGDLVSEEHLEALRPAAGVSPMDYWRWIGKRAEHGYETGEPL